MQELGKQPPHAADAVEEVMVRFQTVQDEPKLVAQVAAALKASNVDPEKKADVAAASTVQAQQL